MFTNIFSSVLEKGISRTFSSLQKERPPKAKRLAGELHVDRHKVMHPEKKNLNPVYTVWTSELKLTKEILK